MPNICDNLIYLLGPQALIEEGHALAKADVENDTATFIEWLCGQPKSETDPYKPWGTKWVTIGSVSVIDELTALRHFEVRFDSAWSPPLDAYLAIENVHPALSVEAMWNEGGLAFCGRFTTESGIEDYQYGGEGMLEDIPSDIRDKMGIDDWIEESAAS